MLHQVKIGYPVVVGSTGGEYRRPFAGSQQWRPPQCPGRLGQQGFKQLQEMPGQALDAGALEQIAGVIEGAIKLLFATLIDKQPQINLRSASFARQARQLQPGQLIAQRHVVPLQAEQHLEQRVVAEAALRLQRFHQLLEWQVLMRLGRQHAVAYLQHQGAERLRAIDAGAQHLDVDEQADQAFALAAQAVGHRHPDTQVILAAQALQQHIEGCQQQHEWRHVMGLRLTQQIGRQRLRQADADTRATIALLRRTRVIGRQFEDARRVLQLRLPVVELTLALPAGQPVALPQGIVDVLDRQDCQCRVSPRTLGGIQLAQLADQDLHRPAITHHMVQGQQHVVLLLAQTQQLAAQQGAFDQVEPGVGLLRAQGCRLSLGIGGGTQVAERQTEAACRQHLLVDLAALAREAGAQRFVALEQATEGAFQGQPVQRAHQFQGHRHVVGVAGGVQLPEEPHALLGKRQRRTGRALPTLRAIGRGAAAPLKGQGQPCDVRRIEQRTQRQLDGEHFTDFRNDPHRQQRMTADLEEIVVAANLLHPQHRLPDRRQQRFALTLRGLVAARLPLRRRQRLAVKLAIGAQRHGLQVQQLGRHHVVRQVLTQMLAQRVQQPLGVGLRAVRRDITDQLRPRVARPGHHDRLAHHAMLEQPRLDLAQLDTQAAQLDLMVDPADIVDHPVRAPTRQVAGAVHALAPRAKRIGDKPLSRQPRSAQITPRQVGAGDVQLARDTHRHRLQLAVENHQAGVGDRPADGHAVPARLVDAMPVTDIDGRFGRPIKVVQRRLMLRLELLLQLMGQCLATAHHLA